MRGGDREFNKIIHHYETFFNGKWHKVGIKMRVEKGGSKVRYYTEHFKEADGRTVIPSGDFKTLPELYDWIDERMNALPDEIVWVSKIYVRVKGYSYGKVGGYEPRYNGQTLMHCDLGIEADVIEVATDANGVQWFRAPGDKKRREKFKETIGYGLEKRYESSKEPGDPYSRALIDDTPLNRELLVAFSVKFDAMRDQFFRAFAPEYVHQFLAHAGGTLLLDAPQPQKGKKK